MRSQKDVPVLIAQAGPSAGQSWPLTKDLLTVGRDAGCDVMIADRQVSRVHARLRRVEDGYELEDLGSRNGTHVNGSPVRGKMKLQDGDLIQIALVARLIYVGSEATVPLRVGTDKTTGQLVSVGRLRLDSASRRVWVRAQELDPPLSAPQFRFLELLYQRPGQVVARDDVVRIVWPEAADGEGVSEQAVDALVRRLRDRLSELDPAQAYVVTVRGHGFRLDNPPA